jgi:molybdate-binding protein
VKPFVVPDVLRDVKGLWRLDQTLVSIAAGVPTAFLEELVGLELPVVRVMPNTPCLVGEGASAVCGGRYAGEKHLARVKALFGAVGMAVQVEETLMDAVTGLSGSGPARVLLGRVGDRDVLRPLSDLGAYRWPAAVADGVAEVDGNGSVTWRPYGPRPEENLFLTGCDPALGLLAEHLRAAGVRAFWFESGSGAAADQLSGRRTHLAAVHWTADRVAPQAPQDALRIELSRWQMGFVVRNGGRRVRGAEDLAQPGLRIANREQGAGARSLMDQLLAAAGVSTERVQGYEREMAGHWEVADAVTQGAADVGIASGAAAAAFSLDFQPLSVETCEVWWLPGGLAEDTAARVGDILASAAFRRDLAAFGPYDTSNTGHARAADQRGNG